jgi:hypothetical protein
VFTKYRKFNGYNPLTGILFVARKYRNESYLSSSVSTIHNKQQDHNISKVKIPYFFTVSIRDKIGYHKNGKPINATQDIISKKPFPKEWDIAKTVPVEIIFLNKCPKCDKEGRPRVDKKNTKDYTHYNKPSTREEYRLIYNHKENKKIHQCVIAKFDEKHGIFTKTGKISKRVTDYIFPNYLLQNK